MQTLDVPVNVIITGTFRPEIDKEEYNDSFAYEKDEIDQNMRVELEIIAPTIFNIIPNTNIELIYITPNEYKPIGETGFEYTAPYLFRIISSDDLNTHYSDLLTIFRDHFNQVKDNRFFFQNSFVSDEYYTGEMRKEFAVLDLKEATKENIRARTAKGILLGHTKKLPVLDVVNKITGFVGKILPESAPRARSLAPELSNAKLVEYNMRAITRPSLTTIQRTSAATVVPTLPVKKPWYKFWGGKRKTLRKKNLKYSRKNKRTSKRH